MAIDTIDGGVDPSTVVDTLTTLLTGTTTGSTDPATPTVEPSTIVSILNNAALVDTSSISELVTVSGVDSIAGSDKDGSALLVTDNSRPVTVSGGSGERKLIVGNDVAGTQINTGTGSGTVVGGDGGSVIGTSANATSTDHFSIMAGKGDDVVVVTNGNNTIAAGTGNNLVGLFGGNNFVYAAGNDTVFAGSGNDTIGAGAGNTTLVGGAGNATLLGGTGNGLLVGGSGSAVLFAGDGASGPARAPVQGASASASSTAGTGAVTLMGGSGSANMIGGAKGDMIVGGSGNSTLFGGGGNDTLIGGTGTSTLYGGADNNLFVFSTVFGGGRAVIGDFGASAGNKLVIQGYGSSTADLVKNAIVAGGSTSIVLNDGTQITLVGFTGLNSSNFA